jgi:hypothetical protein
MRGGGDKREGERASEGAEGFGMGGVRALGAIIEGQGVSIWPQKSKKPHTRRLQPTSLVPVLVPSVWLKGIKRD